MNIKRMIVLKNSHISPDYRREPIFTKFGTAGRLTDLITHDNVFINRLRRYEGSNFAIFLSPGCHR